MPIEELVWEALPVHWTCIFSTFFSSPGKASAFASNARITADDTKAELDLCLLLSHLQGSRGGRYCRFLCSSLVLIVNQTDGVVMFSSQIWWTKTSKPSPFLWCSFSGLFRKWLRSSGLADVQDILLLTAFHECLLSCYILQWCFFYLKRTFTSHSGWLV